MKNDKDMINIEETAKFNLWFNESWNHAGGLINKTTAGKIIGVSPQYIGKLIAQKKLKAYTEDEVEFLSLKEVKDFKINRDAEKILKS
jgi:hypothetical protein